MKAGKGRTAMTRYVLLILTGLLVFAGVDCRKNPVGPPSGADTTSNSFAFQTYTFGDANAGSSYLQDIAVINDTDAWAVGTVYLDSADGAPDPYVYNAVHWDGSKWTVLKIPYIYQGQPFYHPIQCVFALGPDDVWFGGNGLEHWDGTGFSNVDAVNQFWSGNSMGRIWASSDDNVYVVGSGGTIVHYTSGSWTKITSGTDLSFDDIYGSGGQILAVAYDAAEIHGYSGALYSISGNTATEFSIYPIKLPSAMFSVWFVPNVVYYLSSDYGSGVYEKQTLSDSAWSPLPITGKATTGIRGNGTNDVYAVSAAGDFLHWNGERWKSFRAETGLSGGGYSMVGVNGKLVIAVGSTNSGITQAAITVARRN